MKPLVLVVEDDIWQAEQHVRTLEQAGFRASYVLHALSAIDEIDKSVPAVIVLDMFLAGPNGLALLAELRSHSDLSTIPVILCSSVAALEPTDMAAYGIVSVLDKATMHPGDLVTAVQKLIL